MIDSHCHLDADAFSTDLDAVLSRAAAAGLTDLIVPAVDEESWSRIASLPRSPVRSHAAWGIHPVALPALDARDDTSILEKLAARVAEIRPVAIGECGLDTSIDLARAPIERQERILRGQIALARTHDLPLVLHARGPGCYARLLDLLEREALPARGGVVHSYGGGADLLERFLRLPLFFGFAGPATWPNARKVRASIQAVPADRLLSETDAPDQCPEPHRPGRNEPAYLKEIIAGLAAARDARPEEIARLTADNARRLFALT